MAISAWKKPLDFLNYAWPVGSIYISMTSTSPEELFGGTWEVFATGKTLIGYDGTDTDFDTVGNTGGTKSHTLIVDEMPSHNHTFTGSSATSGNQSADHTHTYTDYYATTTGNCAISVAQLASHTHKQWSRNWYVYPSNEQQHTAGNSGDAKGNDTGATGSGNNHNHSGANTSTTRTSNGISANHTHTLTAAGSVGNAGGGGSFSLMNPYIVVYMWKRTA